MQGNDLTVESTVVVEKVEKAKLPSEVLKSGGRNANAEGEAELLALLLIDRWKLGRREEGLKIRVASCCEEMGRRTHLEAGTRT